MADKQPRLVLGSASPRRAALLADLGVDFVIETASIDEQRHVLDGDPVASVQAIARAKFDALAQDLIYASDPVTLLTADTLVSCRGAIMGKPESNDALRSMLRTMSDCPVTVVTAVCVGSPGSVPTVATVSTVVHLRVLSEADIEDYVATGVGMDKAGGLALQAQAGPFIDSVDGCWSNVLGLPVCVVADALRLTPSNDPSPCEWHAASDA